MVHNKLVRDKIPDKIINNGELCETRILHDEEYEIELNKKLIEEANEVVNANDNEEIKEELADLYEVMSAKLDIMGISFSEIEEIAEYKREKRGSFKKKIYLISTKSKDE